MTDAVSITDRTDTCLPNGTSESSCGCTGVRKSQRAKAVKFGAGFFTLCAICCAVPSALITFGLIGITTGTYLSAGSTVALIVLALLGLGYLLMNSVKKKR